MRARREPGRALALAGQSRPQSSYRAQDCEHKRTVRLKKHGLCVGTSRSVWLGPPWSILVHQATALIVEGANKCSTNVMGSYLTTALLHNCSKVLNALSLLLLTHRYTIEMSVFTKTLLCRGRSPYWYWHCGGVGQGCQVNGEGCQPLLFTGGKLGFRVGKRYNYIHCTSSVTWGWNT